MVGENVKEQAMILSFFGIAEERQRAVWSRLTPPPSGWAVFKKKLEKKLNHIAPVDWQERALWIGRSAVSFLELYCDSSTRMTSRSFALSSFCSFLPAIARSSGETPRTQWKSGRSPSFAEPADRS